MSSIHSRLEEERKRLLLTQMQASERMGVSRLTQGKYESGQSSPNLDYISRMRSLGADVRYIIEGVRSDSECGGVKMYEDPSAALDVVLLAQDELGVTLGSKELKLMIGFAYTHQVKQPVIVDVIKMYHFAAGKSLDSQFSFLNAKNDIA